MSMNCYRLSTLDIRVAGLMMKLSKKLHAKILIYTCVLFILLLNKVDDCSFETSRAGDKIKEYKFLQIKFLQQIVKQTKICFR
jgi:hypothetical protein